MDINKLKDAVESKIQEQTLLALEPEDLRKLVDDAVEKFLKPTITPAESHYCRDRVEASGLEQAVIRIMNRRVDDLINARVDEVMNSSSWDGNEVINKTIANIIQDKAGAILGRALENLIRLNR